jgi:RHS repeat-associated protein
MTREKIYRLFATLVLVFILPAAWNAVAWGDDEFDQTFRYLPQVIAPDVSSPTGAMTYKIPIEVPKGRGGIQPGIYLSYNSFRGNGWIGVGWDLNFGYIQRSTKFGVNYACSPYNPSSCGNNHDHSDFIVQTGDSSQELVSWGSTAYGTAIEHDFSKYVFNSGTGGWVATDKSGVTRYYGSTSASRQFNSNGTFRWMLDKVVDIYGNSMTASYTTLNGQVYLAEIDYTGGNKVVFKPETRSDTPTSYSSYSLVQTTQRLSSISVYGNGILARKYGLTYTQSGDTTRSLLQKVIEYGSDGVSVRSSLPDFSFLYQSRADGFGTEYSMGTRTTGGNVVPWSALPPHGSRGTEIIYDNSLGSNGIFHRISNGVDTAICTRKANYNPACLFFWFIDLWGNGDPDIVYIDNSGYVHVVTISSHWSNVSDYTAGQLSQTIVNVGHIRMADVNGDGLLDIIYDGGSGFPYPIHVLLNQGNGHFAADQIWGYRTPTPNLVQWSPGPFKMADMNGDGKADYVYDDGTGKIQVMLSTVSFTGTTSFFQNPTAWGTLSTTNYISYLADLNGDGMTDLVYLDLNDGSFRVLLNAGTTFGPETIWAHMLNFPYNQVLNSASFFLGDVNGDGYPDLVYDSANNNGIYGIVVHKNTGSGFMAPITYGAKQYNSLVGENGSPSITFADVDGDGLFEFIYDTTGEPFHQFRVLPLSGLYSDYLTKASNGISGTQTIQYGHTEVVPDKYYPYFIQTPSAITSNDGKGDTSTTYWSFASGYYNFLSKEFRGFGNVTKSLPDSNVKYTFLQDDVGKNLMSDKLITSPNGASKYEEWSYSYNLTNSPHPNTHFPSLTKTSEIHWDQINNSSPQTLTTSYLYDSYGNPTSIHHKDDNSNDERYDLISYTYNTSHWLLSRPSQIISTSSDGTYLSETLLGYNSDNALRTQPTSETFCLSSSKPFNFSGCTPGVDPTIHFSYNSYGNLTSQIDPNGNPATLITYDATNTFPYLTTDPAGHRTQTTYNYQFGELTAKIDLDNGIETDYAYDKFGRLNTVVELPNDSATYPTRAYSYNSYGSPSAQNITLASRVKSGTSSVYSKSMYFDGLGRVTRQRADGANGKSIYIDSAYDVNGRLASKSYPFIYGVETEKWTRYTYDPLGRTLTQTNPDKSSSSTTYAQGKITLIDPAGRKEVEMHDALGRLISLTQYQDSQTDFVTAYQYDPLGNLTSVTDPENNATTVTYNSLSRRIGMSAPDTGQWAYGYDSNGNLTTVSDANGSSMQYKYDALNRITLKHLLAAGSGVRTIPDTIFTYDQPGSGFKNGVGELTSVTDASGKSSFGYDRDGRTILQSSTVNGQPFVLETQYDDLGRIEQITYPDNSLVNYAYDGAGNLSGVTGSATYASFAGFTGLGQPGSITFGNGVTTGLTYNVTTDSRLNSILTATPASGGNTTIQALGYTYDHDGNILTIAGGSSIGTQTFTYDGLSRLKTASSTNSTYNNGAEITFQYSPSGNIETNSMIGAYSYTGPKPHAVVSTGANTYGYDANGNMIKRNSLALAYDPENRLAQAGTCLFTYDFSGMRAIKNGGSPAATTTYFGKYYQCTNGACTKHIFARDRRIASVSASGVSYYHPDHLGGLNAATNATGGLVEKRFYYPYGQDWIATPTLVNLPHKFTGQESDPETGLYYYKARYYDPQIGRFLSPDPLLQTSLDPATAVRSLKSQFPPAAPPLYSLEKRVKNLLGDSGGTVSTASNRIRVNPYAYCLNNPVSLTDPRGLDPNEMFRSVYVEPGDGGGGGGGFDVSESAAEAEAIAQAEAETVAVDARAAENAAAQAESMMQAAKGRLGERAGAVHEVLDPIAQGRRTTAVLETTDGSRIVAGGARDLTPAQRAALVEGEIAAKMPGAHAEVTALEHAIANGLTPSELAVTRSICPDCAAKIEAAGGNLTSPTTAEWPK